MEKTEKQRMLPLLFNKKITEYWNDCIKSKVDACDNWLTRIKIKTIILRGQISWNDYSTTDSNNWQQELHKNTIIPMKITKKGNKSSHSDTTVKPKTVTDSFLFHRHHHQHFHRQYYISQK